MDTEQSPHPPGDRLQAFAQGRLHEADVTLIVAHLETCPDCCRRLESLSQDDPFLSRVRSLDGQVSNISRTLNLPRAPAGKPQVAGYEVLEELGRGGMGVVYRARQLRPDRLVALKVLLAGTHASAEERARFRAEAEAVARVRHPNVVQVFEVGEQDGLLFFSMELIDGGSLADRDGTPLPAWAAATLLEPLARGVAAAHEKGIVHRDLKPANVLLEADYSPHGGGPVPKIGDFGLAKWTEQDAHLTRTGMVAGTPSYMAPEQAHDDRKAVGPAADVWSLGAILYKLLTGRPPFQGPTPLDTLAQVKTRDPVPPRQLQPAIPRDLETICLKCLEKEPRRRYATAGELADDLRRFLSGDPVRARPVGAVEHAWRWARRRPVAAVATAAAVLVATAFLAGWLHFTQRLSEERRVAVREKEEADLQRKDADDARRRAEEGEAKLAEQLDLARRTTMTMQLARVDGVYRQDPAQARVYLEDTAFCPPDLRDFAWGYFYRRSKRDRRTLARCDSSFWAMALSPDGKTLATTEGAGPGLLRLWDVSTGKVAAEWKVTAAGPANVAWSPDGKRLATAGSFERVVRLWDAATGQRHVVLEGHGVGVWGLCFAPDGKSLATGSQDRTVRIWDVAGGKSRAALTGHGDAVMGLAFAPDGRTLASGSSDRTVRLWDVAGEPRAIATLEGHEGPVEAVAWTPDGHTVVSASHDKTLRLWGADAARSRGVLKGHGEQVVSLAVSADGRTLVSGGWDRTVRLWNLPDGAEREVLRGHADRVLRVALSPDGRGMLSAGYDQTVRMWDVEVEPADAILRGHAMGVLSVAVSPDGRSIASTGLDETVRLWDVVTGKERKALRGHKRGVWSVKWSPDGRTLASGGQDETIRLWKPDTGAEPKLLRAHKLDIMCLAFSPDGRTLASGGQDKLVRMWDVSSGTLRASLPGHTGLIWSVAFSPDGATLASAGEDGTTRLWDVATGEQRAEVGGHSGRVLGVAFAPDGKTLATGGADHTIRLWDVGVAEARERRTLRGHAGWVGAVVFADEGRTLVSGGWDGAVKAWDVVTGQQRLSIQADAMSVMTLALAPDGRTLVSGGGDRTVRLWRRAGPEMLKELEVSR